MARTVRMVVPLASAVCLAMPSPCPGADPAFQQQFTRMCRTPGLNDPPEVCREKHQASQAAARRIVAQGGRFVPEIMRELGPYPCMHFAQALLAAIGTPSHDALREALPTARGTILLNTIGMMGYEAKGLIPDLLRQLERPGRDTKYDVTIITTLVQVGADRRKMAERVNAIVTAPQPNTDFIRLAIALKHLGPDAAPVMPGVQRWLSKNRDHKYFDTTLRHLFGIGPMAAPLTRAIVDYYEAHPPPGGYSDNATRILGGIGPGAKASLPLLKAWLKDASGKSYDAPRALMIATAIACIEGQPSRAVSTLRKRVAAALASSSKTAGVALCAGVQTIGMMAHSHPQAARPLVPLVSRALRARKRLGTATAARVVRDMKPALALGTVPDLIKSTSGVYEGAKPTYSSCYSRSVEALRSLAPYDKRVVAALDHLSKTDPHIAIRNMAREAVVYANAVGPLKAR